MNKKQENKEWIKYEFTKEDLTFVKSLIGDFFDVTIRDTDTIEAKVKETKYINGGILNLNWEYRKEVEKYFEEKGLKVNWNNMGAIFWIYIQEGE